MRALVAVVALALGVAGCSGSDEPPSADPSASPSTSPADVTELDSGPVGVAIVGDDLVLTHPDERKIYTLALP